MCGLCYAYNLKKQPARDMIIQQFEKQRSRGLSGFGFVADIGTPLMKKRTKEEDIKKELKKCDASEILFHHRIPTSTDNVINACHPFKIKGKDSGHWYYVVHNGVISNTSELEKKHKELGIKYKSTQPDGSFNDSEALAVEIMLFLEKHQEEIEARGSVAFICMEFDENSVKRYLHFYRNSGNPLKYKIKLGSSFQIASEGPWPEAKQDVLYTLDYGSMQIAERPLDIKRWLPTTTNYDRSRSEYYRPSDDRDWDDYNGTEKYKTSAEISWEAEYDQRYVNNELYDEGFTLGSDIEDASFSDSIRCEEDRIEKLWELDAFLVDFLKEENQTTKYILKKEIDKIKDMMCYLDGLRDGVNLAIKEAGLINKLPFGGE